MPDVNVTQAVREAAADYLKTQCGPIVQRIQVREGRQDDHPIVQLLARVESAALDRAIEVAEDPDIYSADDIAQAIRALKEPT